MGHAATRGNTEAAATGAALPRERRPREQRTQLGLGTLSAHFVNCTRPVLARTHVPPREGCRGKPPPEPPEPPLQPSRRPPAHARATVAQGPHPRPGRSQARYSQARHQACCRQDCRRRPPLPRRRLAPAPRRPRRCRTGERATRTLSTLPQAPVTGGSGLQTAPPDATRARARARA